MALTRNLNLSLIVHDRRYPLEKEGQAINLLLADTNPFMEK
jgi:hypothetical protein